MSGSFEIFVFCLVTGNSQGTAFVEEPQGTVLPVLVSLCLVSAQMQKTGSSRVCGG